MRTAVVAVVLLLASCGDVPGVTDRLYVRDAMTGRCVLVRSRGAAQYTWTEFRVVPESECGK